MRFCTRSAKISSSLVNASPSGSLNEPNANWSASKVPLQTCFSRVRLSFAFLSFLPTATAAFASALRSGESPFLTVVSPAPFASPSSAKVSGPSIRMSNSPYCGCWSLPIVSL